MPNNPLRALRRILPNAPTETDPRRALRLVSPGYAGSDLQTQLDDEPQSGETHSVNPLRTGYPQADAIPAPGTPEYEQAQSTAMQVSGHTRPQRGLAANERDYQNKVNDYEPRNEGWGKTALRMGIGFATGGPAGAALPLLNRKAGDQQWKRRELAQSVGIEQEQAQTDAMRNPLRQPHAPIYRTRTDEKGNKVRQRIDLQTGEATDEVGPDGKPVLEQLAPTRNGNRPVRQADEAGNEYWADAGTGEPLLDAKGGIRYVKRAATGKAEPDREVGGKILRKQSDGSYKVVWESPDKPDSAEFTNSQIRANLDELATLKAKTKEAIASTAEFLPTDTQGVNTPNPIYRDLKAQDRALDDEARGLRLKLKPEGKGKTAAATHGFSVSAWLKANPGKTKADAMVDHDANWKDYAVIP